MRHEADSVVRKARSNARWIKNCFLPIDTKITKRNRTLPTSATMKYLSALSALFVATAATGASAFAPNRPFSSPSSSLAMATATGPAPAVMEILEAPTNNTTSAASGGFAIAPDDLVALAKDILVEKGIGTKDGGACLAEDFEFVAAVVGPIPKEAYLKALGGFRIEDGFDLTNKFFGFSVDPTQPNRVWFFQRLEAVHTGTFMGAEPTGKEITYPPQANHMDFDEEGKVTEFGFYTVDRRQGDTGGLGGAFGLMYAVGKPLPIPECQPYKPSKRFRFLQLVGRLGSKLQKKE